MIEGTGDLISRLERAELQLKSLQRTARTSLQVVADLRDFVSAYAEELDARSEEDAANGNSRSYSRAG